MSEQKTTNLSSALHWLPRLKVMEEAMRPAFKMVPRTTEVHYDHQALINHVEDGVEWLGWPDLIHTISGLTVDAVGGFPVFVRTDLSSAKHGGPSHYLIRSLKDVPQVLLNTACDSEMKFWMDRRGGPRAFLIREFLEIDAHFVAFAGLPIGREWRFFASKEGVLCSHPYWPELAFAHQEPSRKDWRECLRSLHLQPHKYEWEHLTEMAVQAATAASTDEHPRWSVDFARDVHGRWWLLDMAVMEESWHWPDCVNDGHIIGELCEAD